MTAAPNTMPDSSGPASHAFERRVALITGAARGSGTPPRSWRRSSRSRGTQRTVDINLTGVWRSMRHELPAMLATVRTPLRRGGRGAHGMLTAGLISSAIAHVLPGPGSAYTSQTLAFKLPVRPGDMVTVRLEVFEPKRRVRLSTACTNDRGEVVVDGEAWVTMLDR